MDLAQNSASIDVQTLENKESNFFFENFCPTLAFAVRSWHFPGKNIFVLTT
jgi:hypothetical protein